MIKFCWIFTSLNFHSHLRLLPLEKDDIGYHNVLFWTSAYLIRKIRIVSWNMVWEVKWSFQNSQPSSKQKSEVHALLRASTPSSKRYFQFSLEWPISALSADGFVWLYPEKPVKLFITASAAAHGGGQWPSMSFGRGNRSACSTTDGCTDRGRGWHTAAQSQEQEASSVLRWALPGENRLQVTIS